MAKPACNRVPAIITVQRRGSAVGAVMLTDEQGRISGLFTDSDLARLFELRKDAELDAPIHNVMTRDPISVEGGMVGWPFM